MSRTNMVIIAGILLLGMQAAGVRAEEPAAAKPPDLTAGGGVTVEALALENDAGRWLFLPNRSADKDAYALALRPNFAGMNLSLEFEFTAGKLEKSMNRAVLEITVEGRPTVMLVPLTLLNGSVMGSRIQIPLLQFWLQRRIGQVGRGLSTVSAGTDSPRIPWCRRKGAVPV